MIISTVKHFNTHTMNEKRLNRTRFGRTFSDITDIEELKKQIADALKKKGRVYGVYHKKELVGIYIFERIEDYFSVSESGVKLGANEFDFQKFWYGECTAALHFTKCVCSEEAAEYREKIEKDLREDLKEQIQFGQVAGVCWNDTLMYRRSLQKKKNAALAGSFLWGIIGFAAGWMLFDSIVMAISFACMYSLLFGGDGIVLASGTQIDELDFVQKREGEVDATD